jgi:hypothetical protein
VSLINGRQEIVNKRTYTRRKNIMLDVVFGVLLVGTILFGILSDFEDRGIAILEIIIIVSGCIYFGW